MNTTSNTSTALIKFQNTFKTDNVNHLDRDRDQCDVGYHFNINRPLPNLSQH